MPEVGQAWVTVGGRDAQLKSMFAQDLQLTRQFTGRATGMLRPLLGMAGFGGVAATLKSVISHAAQFEKQMASVATMLSANTMPMLSGMSRKVHGLSVVYGETTASLSKGLYDILSSSIAASKAMGVLETAVIAAKAGMTTTAISADILTTILNAFNFEAEKAVYVTDVLFMTVKRGKTTFPELAQSLGMVATNAALVGVSLEELSAAVATMTRAGVQTRWAVTAMNAIMMGILKPMESSTKAAKELGFELSTAGVAAEGFVGMMERIAGLPGEKIAELFPNIRALRGLNPLLANIHGYVKDVKTITESAGATAEAFRKSTGTLAHRLDQFKQWWNKQMVGVGKPLTPLVGGILDVIQGEYRYPSPTELYQEWRAKQPAPPQAGQAQTVGIAGGGGFFGMFDPRNWLPVLAVRKMLAQIPPKGETPLQVEARKEKWLAETITAMEGLHVKGKEARQRREEADRAKEAAEAEKNRRDTERRRQRTLLRTYMETATERIAAIRGVRAGQEANLQALFGAAAISELRAAGKPKAAERRAIVLAFRAEMGRIREEETAARAAAGEDYGKWQFDLQRDLTKRVRDANLAIIERRHREREEREEAREAKTRAREEANAMRQRRREAARLVGDLGFRPRVPIGFERWGGAGQPTEEVKVLQKIERHIDRVERNTRKAGMRIGA